MSALAFFLGLAFTAVVVSTASSLVVAGVVVALGRRLSSARQADLALGGGLFPGAVAVVVTSLVALPALLAQAGLMADHCLQHEHHWHLCPQHLIGLPAWMALCGAFAAAFALARAVVVVVDGRRQRQLLMAVSALGMRSTLDDGSAVVIVDGPPTLLHAADDFVIASRDLLVGLSDASRRASLQHEAAHIQRGDSRWLFVLSLASSLSSPFFGAWIKRRYRQAAEEAADEEAAAVVGVVDLAAAIVDVSRLRQRSSFEVSFSSAGAAEMLPGVDGADVERRVLRLLSLEPRSQRSGAAFVIAAFVVAGFVAAPFFDDVHHLAESALAAVESARHAHKT